MTEDVAARVLVPVADEADVQAVSAALPELEQVEDSETRQAIAEVWARMWRSGSWPDLESAAYSLHPDVTCGVVEHTRAVVNAVVAAAKALQYVHGTQFDLQRLLTVALLHDVSKLIEYEPAPDGGKRASALGRMFPHAALGGFACLNQGLPVEVAQEVLTHTLISPTAPQSLEGVVLYYVDMACSDLLRYDASAPLHLAGHGSTARKTA